MNTVVQFFMIFFWTAPVGVASAMVSFEKMEKKLPFLKNCKNLVYFYQFCMLWCDKQLCAYDYMYMEMLFYRVNICCSTRKHFGVSEDEGQKIFTPKICVIMITI